MTEFTGVMTFGRCIGSVRRKLGSKPIDCNGSAFARMDQEYNVNHVVVFLSVVCKVRIEQPRVPI